MIFASAIAFLGALLALLASRKYILRLNLIAIGFLIFFPTVASAGASNIGVGEAFLHFPSVFGFAVAIVTLTRETSQTTRSGKTGLWILFVGIGLATAITLTETGRSGLISLANCMISPILLSLSTLKLFRNYQEFRGNLVRLFIWSGLLETLLASAQYLQKSNLIFSQQLIDYQYWYSAASYTRSQGTFDHPLILATFLLLALVLTLTTLESWWKWPVALILLVGIILTQSRSAVSLAIFSLAISFLISRTVRLVPSLIVSLFLALSIWNLDVFQQALLSLLGKNENDYGSSQARADSLAYLMQNPTEFLFGLNGFTSSFALKSTSVLNATLENGVLMWLYDLGIVCFTSVVFGFLSQLRPVSINSKTLIPTTLTIMVISYSSISASPVATYIWLTGFIFICNISKLNPLSGKLSKSADNITHLESPPPLNHIHNSLEDD